MLSHEVLEKVAAAFRIFRYFLFQYKHTASIVRCEGGGGGRNVQGEPFDVAVELPREKKRGCQCRVHEIMRLDRNKDGFETHGDLSLGFRSQFSQR
jgi:hypothetical protein